MPAITVTAVNTATDTLTGTAHGLLTGDRCRVRNVGGALPTGLTATVDIFAIRVDADNVKMATSNANALAGTPVIDITGAGSGTTTIEYGLPSVIPNVVMVPGVSQVKSADLNGTFNSLVALYDLLTAQAQSIWTSVLLAVDLVMSANKNITVSGTGDYKHGDTSVNSSAIDGVVQAGTWAPGIGASSEPFMLCTSAGTLMVKLRTRVGDRIKAINFKVFGDGAADVTTTVFYTLAAMTSSSIGTATTTNQAASWSTVTIDVTDTTMTAGDMIDIRFVANAANLRIGNIWPTYDHP